MLEKAYTPAETAQLLGIGSSTLRKWSINLENAGYQFAVDPKGHRSFTDRDHKSLNLMKECLDKRMTYADASKTVIAARETPSEVFSVGEEGQPSISDHDMLVNLSQQVGNLIECNQELVRRLDDQQKATRDLANMIERRVEERDRVLMETLRLMQTNARQQIAASEESSGEGKSRRRWFRWGRGER